MVIYSWNTKKKGKKYEAKVVKIIPRKTKNKKGSYADITIVDTNLYPTRARAKGAAQRAVMRLKRISK